VEFYLKPLSMPLTLLDLKIEGHCGSLPNSAIARVVNVEPTQNSYIRAPRSERQKELHGVEYLLVTTAYSKPSL